ncbi:MAG: archease [Gemmatimonadota bacterium]
MTERPADDVTGLGRGVREVEHTADVGLAISGATLEQLFHRAALGIARLMRGDARPAGATSTRGTRGATRSVALAAESSDLLLARWLGELLYLDEVDGFVYEKAEFATLDEGRLEATVRGRIDPEAPMCQLKGVTYHGLSLGRGEKGWEARVILDI